MFDRIAPSYDRLNRILSLGTDQLWRRRTIRLAGVQTGQQWLDLAAGSGDMAAMGEKLVPGSNWVAADPSIGLLRILNRRDELNDVPAVLAGAEFLPFPDGHFDGVTVAFGLRNFEHPEVGLAEIARVMKPGGTVAILEFLAQESGKWGGALPVRFYLDKVLPLIGGWVSGDRSAYRYLAQSSRTFWTPAQLTEKLVEIGFIDVKSYPWMGASVTLTIARSGGVKA